MAPIRTGAFSLRDFLETILPTLIGVCLFAPYVTSFDSFDIAFVAVALFGYAISSPILSITKLLFKYFPFIKNSLKKINEEYFWWSANFDYNELFYIISPDEREYMYLTSAYASSFRSMSFYFLIYAFIQIFSIGDKIIQNPERCFYMLTHTFTPMFGGWYLPTIIVLVLALLIFFSLIQDFLKELNFLFNGANGQYVTFAKKYHRSHGSIAKSIWGEVFKNGHQLNDVKIVLSYKGVKKEETKTDRNGRFQFIDKYIELKGKICSLEIEVEGVNNKFEIYLDENQVPEYIIKL